MPGTFSLFPAQQADLPAILDILRACQEELPPLAQDSLTQLLQRNVQRGSVLLAAQETKVAGVCIWSPVLHKISLLAVLPQARGLGIATALLKETLRRMPAGNITLETFRDGDPRGTAALSLYKKFGFQSIGLSEGYEWPMQILKLRRE